MRRPWTGFAAWLAGLTVLRLVVAAWSPLSPDEAYYWVWSRALAPGYLDHPPMVALWIWLGTRLAGDGALGIRLLGPLSAAVGTLALAQAGRDLGLCRARAHRAALLLNATLLFGAGAVTMTPDTPLLLFWTLTLACLARLQAGGSRGWWLAGGLACGLAMASKYTAVLLLPGVLVWIGCSRQWSRLAHWQPWVGAALAGLVVAPVVGWNAMHGWVSFAKQGGRGLVFHAAGAAGRLGELLAGQALLATPILAVICGAGLWTVWCRCLARRQVDPVAALLAGLSLPAVLVFALHAIGDRVQPNWPAILYPAAALAGMLAPGSWPGRWFRPGIVLGLAMTALIYVQGTTGLLPLSAHRDPTLRLSGGYAGLSRDVAAAARRQGAAFVASDEYGTASLLALLGQGCQPVLGLEPRWPLFALPPPPSGLVGRTGLLLRSDRRHEPPRADGLDGLTPVGDVTRARNGIVAERYTLYRGVLTAGAAAALLPCGMTDVGGALGVR